MIDMREGATAADNEAVDAPVGEMGFRPHGSVGEERTIVGVIGNERQIVGEDLTCLAGVEKVVRIRDETFFARLECFVDLSGEQQGAHMSRFEEVINEAIGEVVLSESPFPA
mgnify:CR=1 FL=1